MPKAWVGMSLSKARAVFLDEQLAQKWKSTVGWDAILVELDTDEPNVALGREKNDYIVKLYERRRDGKIVAKARLQTTPGAIQWPLNTPVFASGGTVGATIFVQAPTAAIAAETAKEIYAQSKTRQGAMVTHNALEGR